MGDGDQKEGVNADARRLEGNFMKGFFFQNYPYKE